MKKMLGIIAVLALLTVACNQTTKPTEEQTTIDSTEMVVDTTITVEEIDSTFVQ